MNTDEQRIRFLSVLDYFKADTERIKNRGTGRSTLLISTIYPGHKTLCSSFLILRFPLIASLDNGIGTPELATWIIRSGKC